MNLAEVTLRNYAAYESALVANTKGVQGATLYAAGTIKAAVSAGIVTGLDLPDDPLDASLAERDRLLDLAATIQRHVNAALAPLPKGE